MEIAPCMAPSGLKKALSFRVVELALRDDEAVRSVSQARGQQRPEQSPRARDGWTVGGSAEGEVSRRNPAADCLPERMSEKISERNEVIKVGEISSQGRNLQRTVEQTLVDFVEVDKIVPPGRVSERMSEQS